MSKRKYVHNPMCAHEGCPERAHYVFDRRADILEHKRTSKEWRCDKHRDMEEWLTPEQPERTTEYVSEQREHGRFFGHWGRVSGPGFKVLAESFPAGSKLIVTARIELPPAAQPAGK